MEHADSIVRLIMTTSHLSGYDLVVMKDNYYKVMEKLEELREKPCFYAKAIIEGNNINITYSGRAKYGCFYIIFDKKTIEDGWIGYVLDNKRYRIDIYPTRAVCSVDDNVLIEAYYESYTDDITASEDMVIYKRDSIPSETSLTTLYTFVGVNKYIYYSAHCSKAEAVYIIEKGTHFNISKPIDDVKGIKRLYYGDEHKVDSKSLTTKYETIYELKMKLHNLNEVYTGYVHYDFEKGTLVFIQIISNVLIVCTDKSILYAGIVPKDFKLDNVKSSYTLLKDSSVRIWNSNHFNIAVAETPNAKEDFILVDKTECV